MGRQCPQMRHKHSLDSVTWAIWAWSRLFPRDNCDKSSLVQMALRFTTEQIQSQHFNRWLWWTKLPGEAVKTSPINCPNRCARCALLCLIGLHFPLDLHSWMCGQPLWIPSGVPRRGCSIFFVLTLCLSLPQTPINWSPRGLYLSEFTQIIWVSQFRYLSPLGDNFELFGQIFKYFIEETTKNQPAKRGQWTPHIGVGSTIYFTR